MYICVYVHVYKAPSLQGPCVALRGFSKSPVCAKSPLLYGLRSHIHTHISVLLLMINCPGDVLGNKYEVIQYNSFEFYVPYEAFGHAFKALD